MVEKKKKEEDIFKSFMSAEDFADINSYMYTGNAAWDLISTDGKGLPVGAITLFYANKGSGKTTITCDMLKRMLDNAEKNKIPFQAAYFDTEGSKSILQSMGLAKYVKSGRLLYRQGRLTYSQLEKFYKKVLGMDKSEEEPGEEGSKKKSNPYKDLKFIIIDSLKMITTDTMDEKDVEAAHFGIKAKAQAEWFEKFEPVCITKGLTTLMITHESEERSAMPTYGGPKKKAACGKSGGYLCTLEIRGSKKTDAKDLDLKKKSVRTVHGVKQESDFYKMILRIPEKSRYHKPGAEVEMLVEYGVKCHNYSLIRDLLMNNGLIKKTPKGYTVDTDILDFLKYDKDKEHKFTRDELNSYIDENEEKLLYQYIIPKDLFHYHIKDPKLGDIDLSEEDEEENLMTSFDTNFDDENDKPTDWGV